METAVIVKVAVSAAPYSIDKPYDYLVPGELLEAAVPGVRVTVPFGRGKNAGAEAPGVCAGPGGRIGPCRHRAGPLDAAAVLLHIV